MQDAYDREDDGIPRLLADQDPGIMERMMDEVLKVRAYICVLFWASLDVPCHQHSA